MVEAYEAKFTPHADMVRDIKFGGAWFEVGIDCQEPDEPGEVTHPDNYWIECINLGGVWWGAQDVLSEHMRKCLDEALQRKIADEHREAVSAWRVRPCSETECCYHGQPRPASCACSQA